MGLCVLLGASISFLGCLSASVSSAHCPSSPLHSCLRGCYETVCPNENAINVNIMFAYLLFIVN